LVLIKNANIFSPKLAKIAEIGYHDIDPGFFEVEIKAFSSEIIFGKIGLPRCRRSLAFENRLTKTILKLALELKVSLGISVVC
jgi:hypothetical protein